MPIIPWHDPFEEVERMMKEFPGVFGERAGFAPSVDVYETKDAVHVDAQLAGVDPKDVEISIDNDILTLRGETKKQSEVDDKNFYRKEVRHGSFFRRVALPVPVVSEKAEATYAEGLLKVTVPKAEPKKAKTIKIAVKN